MRLEPLLDCFDDQELVLLVLLRETEQLSYLPISCDHSFSGISRDPKDRPVVLSMSVGVFDGKLRFADTSKSSDGLDLGLHVPIPRRFGQANQKLLTPSENGIMQIW